MNPIPMKEKKDKSTRFSSDLIPVSAGCVLLACILVIFIQPAGAASITLNENSVYLPMAAGSEAANSSLEITVTALLPYTVTVADSTGRSTHLGYMGNYTGSAYGVSPLNTTLASPLRLSGTSNLLASAQTITPPITDTPQTLYVGLLSITGQPLGPNTFRQPVAYTDPRLPAGSTYRIDLIFTLISL